MPIRPSAANFVFKIWNASDFGVIFAQDNANLPAVCRHSPIYIQTYVTSVKLITYYYL
jgi:hypothetical protein